MKNFFGYVFIVIGGFLGLSLAVYFLTNITTTFDLRDVEDGYKAGFVVGTLLFFGIMLTIVFLLIRTGLRWTRKAKTEMTDDVIDRHLFEKK